MCVQWSRIWILFLATGLIGIGLLMYLHAPVSDSFPIGSDFYPRWIGARALWTGQTPYSQAVTVEAQRFVYRGQNPQDVGVFAFYYPAYLAIILLPFIFLPIHLAGIVWSAAMWALLATFYFWWSWQLKPRLTPLAWGLVISSLLLFRPSIVGILSGQFAPLVLACLFLSWWSISTGEDWIAGLALFAATVKPSLSLLPVLILLLWSFRWRRLKVLAGFGVAVILSGIITFQRIGWWLPDFFHQTFGYANDSRAMGLSWSSEKIFSPLGFMWLIVSLYLFALGLRQLWLGKAFPWLAIFAGLNLNLLITPHTYDYDLMIVLPLIFWLGQRGLAHPLRLFFWILLVSVPMGFSLFAMAGAGLTQYTDGIWLLYPNLLLVAIFRESVIEREIPFH
jgi:hypothetical protein